MSKTTNGIAARQDFYAEPGWNIPTDKNLSKCPTKSEWLTLAEDGYYVSINGSYGDKQLVKYSDISIHEEVTYGGLLLTGSSVPFTNFTTWSGLLYGPRGTMNWNNFEQYKVLHTLNGSASSQYLSCTLKQSLTFSYGHAFAAIYVVTSSSGVTYHIRQSDTVTTANINNLNNGTDVAMPATWSTV